jgi:hypothetical protein
MNRLAPVLVALVACLLAAPASATTVDLVDGLGTLDWDTSVSVTDPAPNASVTHPLFPYNRHPHEGWLLYVENFDLIYEFTSFTKTTDGASQDTITSTIITPFGDPITLELIYGITAVGPDGLPDLTWSGTLSRPYNPTSLFPTLDVRLFNVWDYDIGADGPFSDVATVTTPTGPDVTLVEIEGPGGVTGFRGVLGHTPYTVDTRANVISQIVFDDLLNGTAAPGEYDVAGAFQWSSTLCSGEIVPECPDVGVGGSTAIGGFGGFGPYGGDPVPEPSAAALWLGGLGILLARAGVGRKGA